MDAYDGMSLCGGGLAAFGWLRTPWAAVPLMVLLPMLLDLASFYLEERQNHLIDRLAAGRDRAAALSAMNIGVNLAEIASRLPPPCWPPSGSAGALPCAAGCCSWVRWGTC